MEKIFMTSSEHSKQNISNAPNARYVIWTITLRELIDQLVSFRFLIVAFLVIGLTPLAVYVGVQDYSNRLMDYNRLVTEQQKLAAGSAGKKVEGIDRSWTVENELAVLRAIRPPETLSVLVRGLDGAMPEYWDFSSTGIEEGPAALRPKRLADLLGQLDIEFLIRVVLGLLAILLAFDAVSGEKELGTLRVVFSQPISRAAFLTGKLVAGAITLLIPLIAAFLVALLSSKFFGLELIIKDNSIKVALIAATSAAYLLCFYALGLLISSLTTSQKMSLVVLLVIWVVVILAIPPMATLIAQAASPVQPPQTVQIQKKMLDEDIRNEAEKAMGVAYKEVTGYTDRIGYGYYLEHKEAIDRRIEPIVLEYLNKRRQLLGELQRDADQRDNRQNRVARTIMWLSAGATFANANTDIAGTGDADHAAWLEATNRYYNRLSTVLFENPPIITIRYGGMSMEIQRRNPPSVAELPAFVPPRRDVAATVSRALPSLGVLLVYTVLFIISGFAAFIRYDVR